MVNRYFLNEFKEIWNEENKYCSWLKVEIETIKALKKFGIIPSKDVEYILNNVNYLIEDIYKTELITRHDVFAFIMECTKELNYRGRWFHYGLTSSDIIDTGLSLQLKSANNIIKNYIKSLNLTLKKIAIKYKDTICIGRTHGVHAEFTSFGYKFAIWYSELSSLLCDFERICKRVEVCKLSGALGNFANDYIDVQKEVAKNLQLNSIYNATQTISRTNYAEYISIITLIGNLCGKISAEMRHLAKTEIDEVNEGFSDGQRGSSAMPHKKNPIGFENISGLSRLLNGYCSVSYSNINLWHERDISHSSNERFIITDSTSTLGYMLYRLNKLLSNIKINKDKIERNSNMLGLKPFSQKLMLYIIKNNNIRREEAHSISKQILNNANTVYDVIDNANYMKVNFHSKDIEKVFDKTQYIKNIDRIYKLLDIK